MHSCTFELKVKFNNLDEYDYRVSMGGSLRGRVKDFLMDSLDISPKRAHNLVAKIWNRTSYTVIRVDAKQLGRFVMGRAKYDLIKVIQWPNIIDVYDEDPMDTPIIELRPGRRTIP